MTRVCTSSNRWYQAFSPQQYTHYLKIKSLSDWANCTYEKIYVRLDKPIPSNHVSSAIASSKKALKLAEQLKKEADNYPPQLRHLMKLDWDYSIETCMTMHEVIKGNTEEDLKLLELHRNYIAQKSQYVDEDDLDMRLDRSGNGFSELGRTLASAKAPNTNECETIFNAVNKSLDIDLEEIIIQVKDSIDHMVLKNPNSNFNLYLIKNYDERFAMHRKTVRFLRELMKSLKDSGDYDSELDVAVLSDSENIPIELNYLDRCSSKVLMDELLTNKN
ncbi:hypothetical protein N9478_10330 [Gammaproteobacteria bacterium]|nr:hypothetical protein [Gammaproteobacteria bacterium]